MHRGVSRRLQHIRSIHQHKRSDCPLIPITNDIRETMSQPNQSTVIPFAERHWWKEGTSSLVQDDLSGEVSD